MNLAGIYIKFDFSASCALMGGDDMKMTDFFFNLSPLLYTVSTSNAVSLSEVGNICSREKCHRYTGALETGGLHFAFVHDFESQLRLLTLSYVVIGFSGQKSLK